MRRRCIRVGNHPPIPHHTLRGFSLVPSPSSVAQSRSQRAFVAALLGALLLSLLATIRPTAAAPADVGFIDHSYNAPSVSSPTKDKPQSKVWFADGSWWGGLFVTGSNDYRIHKYNATSHTWAATSTVVDDRNGSQADYLWDGSSLYVASANTDSSTGAILVFKFTYDSGSDTYTLDPDFRQDHDGDLDLDAGLIVGNGPAETVTIAKDSTGQLWVTFDNPVDAANRKVMVNRSTTNEQTWGTAFQLGSNVGPDDISAIIAYGGASVGVLMSEHRPTTDPDSAFHFFSHADSQAVDTTWSGPNSISGGPEFAEDHINLKLTATDSGTILAALKTNNGPNHVQLYSRASNGTWTGHPVVASQSVTRPQVVVDETNDVAYVLYTAPELPTAGDQAIYYKSAPLSTLNFNSSGLGTLLIADSGQDINNVSTAKHGVTTASGLLAIASADTNMSYYHGFLSLGGGGGHPFTDIAGTPFEDDIVWLWEQGITTGCTATKFCPKDPVTRGQMATFLARALDLPAALGDHFTDDDGTAHEDNINRLFEAGITTGCTATKFCPKDPVTRGQMSTFLDRGYELPDASHDFFTDDNGTAHEAAINKVAEAGIITGCGPNKVCPNGVVNRQQMAHFIHAAEPFLPAP
jgi:hypothetical protein